MNHHGGYGLFGWFKGCNLEHALLPWSCVQGSCWSLFKSTVNSTFTSGQLATNSNQVSFHL